jgi:hypothetical protein
MATIKHIIGAMQAVERKIRVRKDCYSPEGRTDRIVLLVTWAHSLERYGVEDFDRIYLRAMAEQPDTATDVMEEVFEELGVETIEEMFA